METVEVSRRGLGDYEIGFLSQQGFVTRSNCCVEDESAKLGGCVTGAGEEDGFGFG